MTIVEQEVIAPAEVTVREVLHRAADLLEEFGWCQDDPFKWDATGCLNAFCAGGAVIKAQEDLDVFPFDVFSLTGRDRLAEMLGVSTVQNWNDDPDRTKAEVVARLRAAAEAAA